MTRESGDLPARKTTEKDGKILSPILGWDFLFLRRKTYFIEGG